MARAINVRGIDERVHDALRLRAARSGRSVEAEVRVIIAEACVPGGADDWAAGLRARARTRTAGRAQTDSGELIRDARDGR